MRCVAALLVAAAAVISGCSRPSQSAPAPWKPDVPLPQTEGTLAVPGLTAPVSVVRDEWGVPHITASNTPDLFFAQGFVQAQDRLFQMDLWRRASLGRLAEVMGANFVQRDAMTRRIQFRGDIDAEWRAYAPGTREIATAFTRGVNAWIDHSRSAWPDEFRLAGWPPEAWQPEDLLSRTDAFVASGGAQDEIFRARLAAAIGAERAGMAFGANRSPRAPSGVDLTAITGVLAEAPRRAGARPFFAGFAAPYRSGSNVWAIAGALAASGAPLLAVDPHRGFEAPSLRYLVHLTAPGWNVAGATSPWLPGVAIGHNDHLAWGMASAAPDVQDIYVEHVNPANPRQVMFDGRWEDMTIVPDRLAVKGRDEPFEFERQYTRHGVVIGVDRQRRLAYALRWSGSEPGAAAEVSALAVNRASTLDELAAALRYWKMPAVDVVAADRSGVRRLRAALEPARRGADGRYPADGRTAANDWTGWSPPVALAGAAAGADMAIASNDDAERSDRIADRLRSARGFTVASFAALQRDVYAQGAQVLLAPLEAMTFDDPVAVDARRRLLSWDREMRGGSEEAHLYAEWERQVLLAAARSAAPAQLADGLAARLTPSDALALAAAGTPPAAPARLQAFLADTLRAAADAAGAGGALDRWRAEHRVVFTHLLGLSTEAKGRFDVGPFPVDGAPHTIQAVLDGGKTGPAFRGVFDTADWDRSVVMNAPGQSGWPDSPHYRDLAPLWAEGKVFPLAFSPAAVERSARQTLTLQPNR